LLLGEIEEFFALLELMVGVAKAIGRVEKPLQQLLAFKELGIAKVVAVAVEDVEEVVDDRDAREQVCSGSPDVHALLEKTEIAVAAGVERNDFAIENCLMSGKRLR
jgi:hypothetical protein